MFCSLFIERKFEETSSEEEGSDSDKEQEEPKEKGINIKKNDYDCVTFTSMLIVKSVLGTYYELI